VDEGRLVSPANLTHLRQVAFVKAKLKPQRSAFRCRQTEHLAQFSFISEENPRPGFSVAKQQVSSALGVDWNVCGYPVQGEWNVIEIDCDHEI
jgi:hypothetical protein